MEKLENMALSEGQFQAKEESSETQYKGISMLEDSPYKCGTSIKYWM
jgi:hypothetical protein